MSIEQNNSTHVLKDILLKGWDISLSIASNNASFAWKVKLWGITLWSALISYSYNSIFIACLSLVILIPIFIFESGLKIVEYKMIKKAHDIETALNTILLEYKSEDIYIPSEGIKINITSFSYQDFLEFIFKKNRFLTWASYLILGILSIIWIGIILCNTSKYL